MLNVSRGSVYYLPRPASAADLALMRRMDELHLDFPFAGSRMLRDLLTAEGFQVWPPACRHADEADGDPGRSTASPTPRSRRRATRSIRICCAICAVTRPNQVWAMDMTYIPDGARLRLSRRRHRLVQPAGSVLAVVDHDGGRRSASRRFEEALARHGKPEIFNTDQGSQFTSTAFTGLLIDNAIAISMDGRGAWRDNVFVERLWRIRQVRGGLPQGLRHRGRGARLRSPGTSTFTTPADHIRALTGKHPIRPTSPRFRRSAGGLNPAGAPLIDAEKSVQTNGATSQFQRRRSLLSRYVVCTKAEVWRSAIGARCVPYPLVNTKV